MTDVPFKHLLWPEGQKPQTVRDSKRRMLTTLVERGSDNGQLARQLLTELEQNQPGPTHVVAQIRRKP